MPLFESMQRAIAFMEGNLLEDIQTSDIAWEANLSPFHFQRTFQIITGISVGTYLRRRRLTLAAQELVTTDSKVIDVALRYGYSTPEAFTKAFRRQHGVTPSEARDGSATLQSYNRLTIQVQLKGVEPVNHRILERDAFQVVGVNRTFACSEDATPGSIPEIGEIWATVQADGTLERLGAYNDGEIEGLLGIIVDDADESDVMRYWVAAEAKSEVPGLATLKIPAYKWAAFEVHGPIPEALGEVCSRIYSEWLPSNGYSVAGPFMLEVYLDEDPTSPDAYSEVWLPVE